MNEQQLYKIRFSTKLEMRLQQKDRLVRGKVMESAMTGAKQVSPIQQIGAVASRAPAGPYAPILAAPNQYVRRWVSPIDRELPQFEDSFEKLKHDIDVKGSMVEAARAAANRDFDDEIIRAATADATVGVDPTSFTTEAFDTTNFRVAAAFGNGAVATGLTVAKLIEARRRMRKAQVPTGEALTLLIGSQQEADLLNQVEVVSKEFNDRPVLVDGHVTRFLGMDIVCTERLPTPIADQRGCLLIAKSGIHLGVWADFEVDIDRRKDLSGHPWQIYAKYSFGAARMQQGRVVQILCADTTGADVTP